MTSKSKFTINSVRLLNSWGYNLSSNTDCTICRCNLNTSSLYNQDKGIDSIIADGICGHSFHDECIKPWINKNKHCPICSAVWNFKKAI
jgi:RING-box protein 1